MLSCRQIVCLNSSTQFKKHNLPVLKSCSEYDEYSVHFYLHWVWAWQYFLLMESGNFWSRPPIHPPKSSILGRSMGCGGWGEADTVHWHCALMTVPSVSINLVQIQPMNAKSKCQENEVMCSWLTTLGLFRSASNFDPRPQFGLY